MDVAELLLTGPLAQLAAMDAGEISSRELVAEALQRAAATRTSVNAFASVRGERALADADAADRRRADSGRTNGDRGRPQLLGVPVAVKDDTDVAGEVTAHGSRACTRVAGTDAEVVRRLRAAGAVLVGRTTMPELAVYGFTESAATGVTRNPWDPARTPGGSSGGSAAAVAAGVVGLATGSDGAGSLRIPAACCGLVGLKPTAGSMPSSGAWNGLSVQGVLTRTVADTAHYLDAIGDLPDSLAKAGRRDPGRLRIGVDLTPMRISAPMGLEPQVRTTVLQVGERLASLGHHVWRLRAPQGVAPQAFSARYLAGVHQAAAAVDRPDLLEPRTAQIARLGATVRPALLRRAVESGPAHGDRMMARIGVDLLLTPVLSGDPVEIGRWAGSNGMATVFGMGRFYAYTPMWNHTGQPAIALPAGESRAGLPLSVQLVAPRGGDALLVSVAAQLERAFPWSRRAPAATRQRRD